MTIHKCDKCGCIFEEHIKLDHRFTIYENDTIYGSRNVDLCRKCYLEFAGSILNNWDSYKDESD